MVDFGQRWLQSGNHALIEGMRLLPRENTLLKNTPLVVSRGQAEAYFLLDDNNRPYILKKFLPGRNPDARYIKAIRSLIPRTPGFESGYQRCVLSDKSASPHGFYSSDFASWLKHTILMPRIRGCDWAFLADQVRDGTTDLIREQRLLMCKSLSEKIRLLEKNNVAHRDLSATNVFIDTATWEVHLIDWDSIYHAQLSMPPNTTFGTNGYIAPFVKRNGTEDAALTWRTLSDRFGLAILNMEFLAIERGSPVTGDGGLFDQEEICALGGSGIAEIINTAQERFPHSSKLFERALSARTYDMCPGPDEWLSCSEINSAFKAPRLNELYDPKADFEKFLQQIQKPYVKAPPLSEVEMPDWNKVTQSLRKKSSHLMPKLSDVENPGKAITPSPSRKGRKPARKN